MNHINNSHVNDSVINNSQDVLGGRPGFLPGIVSKSTLSIFLLINSVIIIFFISLLGSVLNLINVVVFIKQGLKDPITITLCVLSMADFGSVFTLWLQSVFFVLHFFPDSFEGVDPRYLGGFLAWPHSVFVRASCLLVVFIAMERWLCVTFPLHVSRIITPLIAKVYNCVVISYLIGMFVSLYLHCRIGQMYLPWENRTLFLITLTQSGLKYMVHMSKVTTSVYLTTFGLMVIFTILTIVKLNQQTKWRQSMSTSAQTDATTVKNRKVVKMVVAICLIFIATTIPSVSNTLGYMVVPGYIEMGRYFNLYSLVSQLCFTFEASNSSANFFIYLHMSSNYANTLRRLLGTTKKDMKS